MRFTVHVVPVEKPKAQVKDVKASVEVLLVRSVPKVPNDLVEFGGVPRRCDRCAVGEEPDLGQPGVLMFVVVRAVNGFRFVGVGKDLQGFSGSKRLQYGCRVRFDKRDGGRVRGFEVEQAVRGG